MKILDKLDNVLFISVIALSISYYISTYTMLYGSLETIVGSFWYNAIVFATSVKLFYFLSAIFIAIKIMKYITKNKQEITQ